jgi:hypothetical protein
MEKGSRWLFGEIALCCELVRAYGLTGVFKERKASSAYVQEGVNQRRTITANQSTVFRECG